MNLERITKLPDLARFIPKVLALHSSLEGKWEPDLNSVEFFKSLLQRWEDSDYFFGAFKGDEIAYFAVITRESKTKALFWLFYMNPSLRLETKGILNELKAFMKAEKFSIIYSQSTRTSSSYERWLEKFGAEKVAIVYKFKL